MNIQLFRIIDANLNRAREGLRVCEDITRFSGIEDQRITRSLKLIRHKSTKALLDSKNLSFKKLLGARDTEEDTEKYKDFEKPKGSDISNVLMANLERVKESLRVLEECCKVVDAKTSHKYRELRFNTYDVEKKIIKKTGHISYSG